MQSIETPEEYLDLICTCRNPSFTVKEYRVRDFEMALKPFVSNVSKFEISKASILKYSSEESFSSPKLGVYKSEKVSNLLLMSIRLIILLRIMSCKPNWQLRLNGLNSKIMRVTFYSDCCSGQNRNQFVCSLYAVNTMLFDTIDHKCLVQGDTVMECDSM